MNNERAQAKVDAAVALILGAGFVDDGETQRQQVRIPTDARKRFARPDGVKVTVGPNTVNFYRIGPLNEVLGRPAIISIGSASTGNILKISTIISGLPPNA